MTASQPPADLIALRDQWAAQWPAALALWSRFTRLSDPRWCYTAAEAEAEGLSGSFAMIRLTDQAVVIGLHNVAARGLQRFGLEVLAHEIGHHVYAPGDLTDHARTLARMRWALPTREQHAGAVANLYTDLLINNRLARGAGLPMSEIYLALAGGPESRLWTFYLRTYEILWSLQTGTLAQGDINDEMEGDAHLGARLVRAYGRDWLDGAGRYAALCLPYLLDMPEAELQAELRGWRDMHNPGGGMPHGLSEIEPGEQEGAIHPSLDPELSGLGEVPGEKKRGGRTGGGAGGGGQHREPFEYGEILRSMGVNATPHEAAIRYYRERAVPHLVPFPSQVRPESTDPQPEGLEPWDTGSPLEDVDWLQSVLVSPTVFPGLSTVQRVWGTTEGGMPRREPLDLDLYVDSSGSIENPQVRVSYLALAGAIIALSALRAGGRVQATLWSGSRQFQSTPGFVSDEHQILGILTGYFGGSTAFPIHVLRETYRARTHADRPAHILIISDDGVTTMFDKDEQGNSGWYVAGMAMKKARGGGSMVLNLLPYYMKETQPKLKRARTEQGWVIYPVASWEDLLTFARAFAKLKFSGAAAHAR